MESMPIPKSAYPKKQNRMGNPGLAPPGAATARRQSAIVTDAVFALTSGSRSCGEHSI